MEQEQYYQELMEWAKKTTERALDPNNKEKVTLTLGNKELELSQITSIADDYDEGKNTHANVNEVQPYFVADGFRKPEQGLRQLPNNPDYFQLHFNIPIPVEQVRDKQEQLGKWVDEGHNIDLVEDVVADISIEVTPHSFQVTGWNGLKQQPTRQNDKTGKDPAEFTFENINKTIDIRQGGKGVEDTSNPLPELGKAIAKDPLLTSALPPLPLSHLERVQQKLGQILGDEPPQQSR